VIAALKKHDIGYHSNYHSVHPTPSEYLAECGWADGVAEFVRREGPGAADVRRVFGVETLSTYGQPGSSWGPQTLGALKAIGVAPHGVPTYVDEGSHVGLNGEPFWYAGALTVYHMQNNYTRMDLHEPGGLEKGNAAFSAIHKRMLEARGGLVSIFYHPCEWVHRQFWDGVNFSRGANPPREEWKAPPQRSKEETDAAFERFEKYVEFIKAQSGVRFVTASDLPAQYSDRLRVDGLQRNAVMKLTTRATGASAVEIETPSPQLSLSAADQLVAAVEFLRAAIESGTQPERVSVFEVLGPSDVPPATEIDEIAWPAFRDALRDVSDELRVRKQVPSRVFAGTKRIAPADFLRACAQVILSISSPPPNALLAFPKTVQIPHDTKIAAEKHIAEDTPGLFGGWVIHVEGFRAPKILEQARLQAWTLKPAVR
jgi:hypothetical protein